MGRDYEQVYAEREDQLDMMPGGAQGASPDMSDFCSNCQVELTDTVDLIRGECKTCWEAR
jgi:hypothetical protein